MMNETGTDHAAIAKMTKKLVSLESQNAALLEALRDLLDTYEWYKVEMYPDTSEARAICKAAEAIQQAKESR